MEQLHARMLRCPGAVLLDDAALPCPPPPPGRHTRAFLQCVFHTPIYTVPPSRSSLRLFAFEWLQSNRAWEVAVLHRGTFPKESTHTFA